MSQQIFIGTSVFVWWMLLPYFQENKSDDSFVVPLFLLSEDIKTM
jgi:hypothetical protein